jgi:hypothetical protein
MTSLGVEWAVKALADCDACGSANARSRCASCRLVYYCSVDCQRSHWRTHKPECHSLDKMRGMQLGLSDLVQLPCDHVGDCAICLGLLRDPVQLPSCGHAFCFSCLRQYQSISSDTRCPLCRETSAPIVEQMLSMASRLGSRASDQDLPVADKVDACVQGLDCIKRVLGDDEGADDHDPQVWYSAIFIKSQLLMYKGDYEEAMEVNRSIIARDPERFRLHIKPILVSAKCAMATENWAEALEHYKTVFQDKYTPFRTPIDDREVFACISRCYYELGDFDRALELGKGALEMNRHYHGAHDYVARSYLALKQYDDAVATMRRALAYETPWDFANVDNVKVKLEKFIEECKEAKETNDDNEGPSDNAE